MAGELAQARARPAGSRPGARTARTDTPRTPGDPTWVAPRFTPRRNVNPAARRRRIAALGVALALLGAMLVAAIVLAAGPTVKVPSLKGLTEGQVKGKLRRLHLQADYPRRFDQHAKAGTVVGQTPDPGTRVKQDSTLQVWLSRGPAPVPVPSLTGRSASAATTDLHRKALNARVTYVPDLPGTAPGTVTGQSPEAHHSARVHSTVTLFVAETPSWRSVTSFSGDGSGHSVPFKVRGAQWRVVYQMSYDGTCDFVLFCDGPSAQVLGTGTRATDTSFGLSDGDGQTNVFKTGPGQYQVTVKPGLDSAHWSITVQDWY